jgi:hypothetical protein
MRACSWSGRDACECQPQEPATERGGKSEGEERAHTAGTNNEGHPACKQFYSSPLHLRGQPRQDHPAARLSCACRRGEGGGTGVVQRCSLTAERSPPEKQALPAHREGAMGGRAGQRTGFSVGAHRGSWGDGHAATARRQHEPRYPCQISVIRDQERNESVFCRHRLGPPGPSAPAAKACDVHPTFLRLSPQRSKPLILLIFLETGRS